MFVPPPYQSALNNGIGRVVQLRSQCHPTTFCNLRKTTLFPPADETSDSTLCIEPARLEHENLT